MVFFCSMPPAVNRLTNAAPGNAENFGKTFATAKGIIVDIFLPPHPGDVQEKRPMIGKYGVNPVSSGRGFQDYARKTEKAFIDGQAQRKATAGAGKQPSAHTVRCP